MPIQPPTTDSTSSTSTTEALEAVGLGPDAGVFDSVDVVTHATSETLIRLIKRWHSNAVDYERRVGGTGYLAASQDDSPETTDRKIRVKGNTAYECLRSGLTVLLEVEPWYTAQVYGEDDEDGFGRWEPFIIATPAIGRSDGLKYTNGLPLSEVTHRFQRHEQLLEAANADGNDNLPPAILREKAYSLEQIAHCRYGIEESCPADWVDPTAGGNGSLRAIHIVDQRTQSDILINRMRDGSVPFGGGYGDAYRDEHVDVTIGLPYRQYPPADTVTTSAEWTGRPEHKVRILPQNVSEEILKTVANEVDWAETHFQYNREFFEWEADLRGVPEILARLLDQDAIGMVGVTALTERGLRARHDRDLTSVIDGIDANDYLSH